MRVNVFRGAGDCLHLLAVVSLFANIWRTKNCAGISAKSQLLYALVFTTRYLDVFTIYISIYSTILKIFYPVITYCTILSMILFFWKTYEKKHDTVRVRILITSSIVIAMFVNHEFTCVEVLWAFSIYLEAVAMVPQYYVIIESKQIHAHIVGYVAAIGIYRALYAVDLARRYYNEDPYDKIAFTAGIIQFVLNCDFFLQIWPRLDTYKNEKQSGVSEVDVLVDSEVLKSGHLTSNVSTIVLTPASLTGFQDDKVESLTTEKATDK